MIPVQQIALRSNAMSVTQMGMFMHKVHILAGGADYAELVESDGGGHHSFRNTRRFIANDDKVRAANNGETPFGVISETPSLIGNSITDPPAGIVLAAVGLLGRVKILKNQPFALSWIKIKSIDNTYDLWLIK